MAIQLDCTILKRDLGEEFVKQCKKKKKAKWNFTVIKLSFSILITSASLSACALLLLPASQDFMIQSLIYKYRRQFTSDIHGTYIGELSNSNKPFQKRKQH